MKTSLWRIMASAMIPAVVFTACSENDEPGDGSASGDGNGKFVFATTVQGSNATSYVLLTGESLDNGNLSTVNNGLLNDGATQWVFYKDFLYALTYNQGNAGTTRSYILNGNGAMQARDMEYRISRFSSYGAYKNDIITMSTGDGPDNLTDSHGYKPKTLLVTYLDVYNETSRANDTSTGAYSMENFLGNGEYVTLAGAEQSGSKLYCGAVPMGLSQYGAAYDNGKWIRPGYENLVHTEAGGSGSGAYKAGELVGTQYPDECWVAIYDNENMLNPVLARTDKISTPCGRYRSQYYQTVWAAENGDIYVFSASYAKTMTDIRQKTSLPAGVCRIPAGSTQFDDYYCNIEAQTPGGNRSFMRCWPAGGDSFLMIMYDRPLTESNPAATELAIFDASSKKLTYVTGMPDDVTSIGKTVYSQNGKVYIPVNVENEQPAIYAINTATAQAVKGVTIAATDITGFGYMTPVK
ncbi:DUF4374 domain-containing protein [Muribaculum intestinale]|uniref:DUF4374 domain-containing protein n=1 Tax=Muribaculum intestinale TaxID=1796646 RepID=UPI0025AA1409|nr:DUF4374 domain-containing protein [Muribaculum intestinale]